MSDAARLTTASIYGEHLFCVPPVAATSRSFEKMLKLATPDAQILILRIGNGAAANGGREEEAKTPVGSST